MHAVQKRGSGLAREGGLTAARYLTVTPRSNCGSGLAREGGLAAGLDVGSDRVHIRYLGSGRYGFRPYGGSLLERPKSNQKAFAPTLGTSPRLGVPSLRLWSVGRRNGPSLAQCG